MSKSEQSNLIGLATLALLLYLVVSPKCTPNPAPPDDNPITEGHRYIVILREANDQDRAFENQLTLFRTLQDETKNKLLILDDDDPGAAQYKLDSADVSGSRKILIYTLDKSKLITAQECPATSDDLGRMVDKYGG